MAQYSVSSATDDGILGASTAQGKAGVAGVNDANGNGLYGRGSPNGVFGISTAASGQDGAGVVGTCDNNDGVRGFTKSSTNSGVVGTNSGGGFGVLGLANGPNAAVVGQNSGSGQGVYGKSAGGGFGVYGDAMGNDAAVAGVNAGQGQGVYGKNFGIGFGVHGENSFAHGFIGGVDPIFSQHAGIYGQSDQQGVVGIGATGVFGGSPGGDGFGVRGETTTNVAVQGQSFGSGLAGKFLGNVEVTGHLQHNGDMAVTGDILLSNADCAEEFDVVELASAAPGTVMSLDPDGKLRPCDTEYDTRVVGVVSGAGLYKPALTLDRQDDPTRARRPIALMGKVYCKVDARFGAIRIGDLLTASPTSGHAMKAADRARAAGAILGKALGNLEQGAGMIPILVTLQ